MSAVVFLHDCAFLLTRTFSLYSRACNGVKFTVYTNHLTNFQLQSRSIINATRTVMGGISSTEGVWQ